MKRMVKRITPFMFMLIFLTGCASKEQGPLDQLNRNDDFPELYADLTEDKRGWRLDDLSEDYSDSYTVVRLNDLNPPGNVNYIDDTICYWFISCDNPDYYSSFGNKKFNVKGTIIIQTVGQIILALPAILMITNWTYKFDWGAYNQAVQQALRRSNLETWRKRRVLFKLRKIYGLDRIKSKGDGLPKLK